jgi:hypothetical protein
MRAEQHVSVPRCGQLAVLTASAHAVRDLPLLKTPEGDDPGPQRSGIRGMSFKIRPTQRRPAAPSAPLHSRAIRFPQAA